MKKRIASMIMTVAMIVSLLPLGAIPALAEEREKYIVRSWDDSTKTVVETEEDIPTDATPITSEIVMLFGGKWYIVSGEVTISDRLVVSKTANIILTDGCTLNATKGISVAEGCTLNIYGQKGNTGTLEANNTSDSTAIGGADTNKNGGTVTVHGGAVNATTDSLTAAGIGGVNGGNGCNITIYGGTVKATCSSVVAGGAGIGGGSNGDGGDITIFGGEVTATGGNIGGAGIGGGLYGKGGDVTVYGGEVFATGGYNATGIGGGNNGDGGDVTVNGGTVTATGGGGAVGIGCGLGGTSSGDLTLGDFPVIKAGENASGAEEVPEYKDEQYVQIHCHNYVNGECTECGEHLTYVVRSWDDSSKTVVETEEDIPNDATPITNGTTTLEGGWYVLASNVKIDQRIEVTGTVDLILMDGCTLTVNGGIEVAGDNALHIYGQEGDSGTISATGSISSAGIGGVNSGNGGTVTVNGGIVNATGGENAAGIGGGAGGNGGDVTIFGGTVNAKGGTHGAGIGGGYAKRLYAGGSIGGNGGTVTIYGGAVTATGGSSGAGIGSGDCNEGSGNGGTVTINGGIVNATGGYNAAGIGGGLVGDGSNVTICGGTVTATGDQGVQAIGHGAGAGVSGDLEIDASAVIKAGENASGAKKVPEYSGQAYVQIHWHNYVNGVCTGCGERYTYIVRTWDDDSKTVVETEENIPTDAKPITSETTRLEGGWYVLKSNVEIGSKITVIGIANIILMDGYTLNATQGIKVAEGDVLNIFGQKDDEGTLIATGSIGSAGIGGINNGSGGTVTINGGIVNATGGKNGAGIGGGGSNSTSGMVTVNGGIVNATGGSNGAGIGGGSDGDGGTVTVNAGIVNAIGGSVGAGIGGGSGGNGGTVTVWGGTVTARGGINSAGIGGSGTYGKGGNVTVYGGEVTATGGLGAAGIGGGVSGDGGDVTVNGGTVTATGGGGTGIGCGLGGTSSGDLTLGASAVIKAGTDASGAEEVPEYKGEQYVQIHCHNYVNWACTGCGEHFTYVVRSWDDSTKKVVETEANIPTDATPITSGTTTLEGGFYVLTSDVEINDRITVSGTTDDPTNIVLMDGCTLTVNGGIKLVDDDVLHIYGQKNDSGTISATGSNWCAGIGGGDKCSGGTLTVYGGTVTATGDSLAAGIGGGMFGSGGTVTVYGGAVNATGVNGAAGIGGGVSGNGGTVTVYGGTVNATSDGGAGIGGGGNGGNGGTVTINGGTVNATGGGGGAGIGGGVAHSVDPYTFTGGNGGTVTINGGTVTATGGKSAQAIGHGDGGSDSGDLEIDAFAVIKAGTGASGAEEVPAYKGEKYVQIHCHNYVNGVCTGCGEHFTYIVRDWDDSSKKVVETEENIPTDATPITSGTTALEGGWYVLTSNVEINDRITVSGTTDDPTIIVLTDGCTLTVNGGIELVDDDVLHIYGQKNDSGTVNATGGNWCAGIGGGDGGNGGTLAVYGGTVTATGDMLTAGIGGGMLGNGGTVTVYGGIVNATAVNGGAGIGGGSGGDGGTVTVNAGIVNAIGGSNGAGIGSGGNGGNGGTVTINGGTVNATGGSSGAGIGGGIAHLVDPYTFIGGNGGTVTINGGTVNATGGGGAAGIGGGKGGNGGTVTINGGTVTATGVNGGAGIGGGVAQSVDPYTFIGGNGGTVTINGGTVTAVCGKETITEVTPQAIGYGADGSDSGDLTLGDFPVIKAGTDASGAEEVPAYKGEQYVQIHCHKYVNWACTDCGEHYTYIERGWDGEKVTETEMPFPTDTVALASSDSDLTLSAGKWYVVCGEVNVPKITVEGTPDNPTSLILTDGCTLNVDGGIVVEADNALNIYGQKGDSGTLNANGGGSNAGIGSIGRVSGDVKHACGTVVIHGGTVNATGGVTAGGAGIGGGGGYDNDGGTVIIYGGTVNAYGDRGAAGIGGGPFGNGGDVYIYGGAVTADIYKEYGGAGIGGGSTGKTNGTLTLGVSPIIKEGNNEEDAKTVSSYSGEYYVAIHYHTSGMFISTGEKEHKCTFCGETQEHSFVDGYCICGERTPATVVPAKDATCTEYGWQQYYILNEKLYEDPLCTKEITVFTEWSGYIPAHHTVVTDAAVAPTCVDTGLTEGSHCSVCGTVLKEQETVPETGIHNWTCDTVEYDTTDEHVCSVCGATEKHQYAGGECTACGAKQPLGKYVERSWNGSDKVIEETERDVPTDAKVIKKDTDELTNGWYVVAENLTLSDETTLFIKGDNVNIVLLDGCTLCSNYGIVIEDGAVLNVYGQANDSGKINAFGEGAAIQNKGTLNIYGGTVTAAGGGTGAGIEGNNVYVYGGSVNATGGGTGGAGIEGDNVYVYGGSVEATGGNDAAGIGGSANHAGANFYYYGGTVIATGDGAAVGIGAGKNGGAHGAFVIDNETVTAVKVGGDRWNAYFASADVYRNKRSRGIVIFRCLEHIDTDGNGWCDRCDKFFVENYNKELDTETTVLSGNILVQGNYTFDKPLVVSGNAVLYFDRQARFTANSGIVLNENNSLTINAHESNTAIITATGVSGAAGIGGTFGNNAGNLTVNGGNITATGGYGAKGIGGGFGGADGIFTHNGGTVTSINGGGFVHEHTFAEAYTYNETHHWHTSTCGHNVVSDFGAHVFDGGVTVGSETTYTCECGYTKVESAFAEETEYRINSITVCDQGGNPLQAIPTGSFLATVSVTKLAEGGNSMVLLASYTAGGYLKGLMYVSVEDLQIGATIKVTLPVDNGENDIAKLKAFVFRSFSDLQPIGNAVTFCAEPQ